MSRKRAENKRNWWIMGNLEQPGRTTGTGIRAGPEVVQIDGDVQSLELIVEMVGTPISGGLLIEHQSGFW